MPTNNPAPENGPADGPAQTVDQAGPPRAPEQAKLSDAAGSSSAPTGGLTQGGPTSGGKATDQQTATTAQAGTQAKRLVSPERLQEQAAIPHARPGAQITPQQVAPLHGPWAAQSLFGNRWTGPARPASRATIIALLVAAAVAALSIPLDRGGVGWLVTAIAGVAALVVARVVPDRAAHWTPAPLVQRSPYTLGKARFFWSSCTVALLAVGTFRAAGWLFFLCLCTAVVTGALAVAGGRSLRAMIVAVLMAPLAGFRALPWIRRGLTAVRRDGGGKGLRIAATVAVSVALLVVFGSLFASADAAFADLIDQAVPDIDGGTVARWIFVFAVSAFVLGGAAFLRAGPPDLTGLEQAGKRRVARLEWAVPLTLLVLLFAMFVAVQLTVLFGGSRHVLDTDGLTYAEYARGGFWQLLIVTGLTLVVLAVAARWAPRDTKTDRMLIRAVLGALAVLTLVIVASATHRMDLYADTYGLTRLRLLVALCEVWLGLVFVMILVAGIRLTGLWLPRAVVGAAVLGLLGLAGANPDRLIADHNVTRYEQTDRIDTYYLSTLSADAVPALDRLTGTNRDCALMPIADGLDHHKDDWRGWNLGRYQARDLLAHDPPHQPGNVCPGTYDLY